MVQAPSGVTAIQIKFDMTPRLEDSGREPSEDRTDYRFGRWRAGRDSVSLFRTTPAARLFRGPLLLAKARRLGMTNEQLEDASTVIGKGYRPVLTRIASDRVMAAWDVRLVKDGAPDITAKACDYQSAADARFGDFLTWFTIWF